MLKSALFTALLAGSTTLAASAQQHQHGTPETVGAVDFPVACNANAQAIMNRAVAMLHSFWFFEARKTFESAAAADPTCGVAWWGVALTHFGNPMGSGNGPEQQALGWKAVEKALAAGGTHPRDRAWIEAAAALFRDYDKVGNRERMKRFETAMQRIVEQYPQDREPKIFHAIYVVANASPSDLSFARQKEAASLLNAMFIEQPQHPGLAHYIIHALDAPPLAANALDAARRYAAIAPAAPHALHMPSHIFTRLGYWDESIQTNRRSADLEPTPGGKAHPMDYMVYAYLQQGRDDAAKAVLNELGTNPGGDYVAGTLSSWNARAMPARYALERDAWAEAAALPVADASPVNLAPTRFARALGAARAGNTGAAKAEVAELARLVETLKAANETYWAHVVEAQRQAVDAWVAHHEGRHADALRIARAAADLEDQVEKHPVTPGPLIPARELLGDILMVHNDHAGALAAYEETLKREPNRFRTLLGAARAAKAASRPELARKYYRELVDLLDPQTQRPALAEARASTR